MADCYIGIDSGTQSTKALVIDGASGRVLGSAARKYDLIAGLPTGHMEQAPQDWIDAIQQTIPEALKTAQVSPEEIRAIGVSGQQHGFVPLDAAGEVIRPAKLWCDTSTQAQCEQLISGMGGLDALIRTTGNGMPPGFTASKILWMKENEPDHFLRLAHCLLPHDYINYWLTGIMAMEPGDASGTALLDVRTRQWAEQVMRLIDPRIPSLFPPLRASHEVLGPLRPEAAQALGLPGSVLVSAGGGDNMMGAIGTGNTRPGVVTCSLGTSGTIYACSDQPIVDPQGEIAAFCDSTGRWLPLLCTMNVTVATEYIKELFGLDNRTLTSAAEAVPPGAEGLLLLPYFEGERTPNIPDGTGVLLGWRRQTNTPGHFARAAIEGATLGLNYGLNRMRKLGITPTEVRLTGGGSQNRLWRQIAADVFEAETVCLETAEGAALGAALQAVWAFENRAGHAGRSIEQITDDLVRTDEATRCHPRPEHQAVYRAGQALHDEASRALRDEFFLHHRTAL